MKLSLRLMLERPSAYAFTLTQRINLADPRPENINLEDIAFGLASQGRYNGHTAHRGLWQPYTVAQHCLYVARAVTPEARAWAPLHDASEAYLGDLVRPVRSLPGIERILSAHEHLLNHAIAGRFGLPWPIPPDIALEIGNADDQITATEITLLTRIRELSLSDTDLQVQLDLIPIPLRGFDGILDPHAAATHFLREAHEIGIVDPGGIISDAERKQQCPTN